MRRGLFTVAFLLVLLCVISPAASSQGRIGFDDPAWVFRGEGMKVERYLDKEALRVRTGRAFLPDVDFESGTIEFDFATTGSRSFVGRFGFRLYLLRQDSRTIFLGSGTGCC